MRLLKSHPILRLANSYLVDSPQPLNLSYMWNFGSLLAICLIIQIITGVTLAMHYNPSVAEAFNSVEHIMRDVNNGWLIRYLHSNTASAFFFIVYLHIGRGMYYGSYRAPRTLVWTIGTVIFILMMATAFLGYVLPYGQMSLWGATVITNLMSAIPWVGQDIVESNNFADSCITVYSLFTILPTIGTVNTNALKKENKNVRLNKEEYLSIPPSFLSFLVGFIDGDGYIQITKTTKGFIAIKLVISIHLKDISTLEYIRSILNIGKITIYKDNRSPTCKLIINKTDLQEVLFPLLLHHNLFFLTETRNSQFNTAMVILEQDIKRFDSIPNISNIPKLFYAVNPEDYVKLSFFKNWIVGFTMAEGSFFIKSNNDGCFQLKQRMHTSLFESFKLVFNTNRKIDVENNLYNQFSVNSKADIQTVINFFSFSGLHPLIGLKGISYLKWLNDLKSSNRYGNLNYPSSK